VSKICVKNLRQNFASKLCVKTFVVDSGEIVGLLSANRRVGADLIADVIDQSADNLVDGVTAGEPRIPSHVSLFLRMILMQKIPDNKN